MSRVPVILLKVLSGPDHGHEKRFSQYCVRVGRDYRNDFVLSDRFVSGRHGKLVWESGALIYYDLQSRHGTAVSTILQEGGKQVEKSIRLQDQNEISRHPVTHGAQLLLGSTLLHLALEHQTKEDTYEEQAVIHQDDFSLHAGSMGELTATPSESDVQPGTFDPHPSSPSYPGYTPTSDGLPAPPPSTAIPPTGDTMYYQEAYHSDPNYALSVPETPPQPVRREGGALQVPHPGPQPKVPASSLLSQTVTAFSSDAGGALGENIRKGLSETMTDMSSDHLLVGSNYSPWGKTQAMAAFSVAGPDAKTESFNESDLSMYARSNVSDSLERSIDKQDPRMDLLFRLTGQLNRLNHIDDILELIVDATFEALRAANFFSICLHDDEGEMVPYLTRVPGQDSNTSEQVTLSQSLMREVAEKREAVLFVRDRDTSLSQSIIDAEIWSCLCAPLIGQRSLLGVMLVDTRQKGSLFTPQDLNLFSVLASSAAFALERAQLTTEIVQMFEGFVEASVTTIEARDPTTAGHSQRVASYSLALAEVVNEIDGGDLATISFSREELVELRYAALLHDIGKVGVRESVLNKATRLTDDNMAVIHQRFETFKAFSSQLRYESLLSRLTREKRPPDSDELLEMRIAQEKLDAELREIFQWVNRIRSVEYLPDEDLEKLEALSKRNVTLGEHQRVPLLLEKELKDLRIRRGTLNDDEWKNMRSHAGLSESFLERIPWSADLRRIPCIAGAHHEKLDGSGYPKGIAGDSILPQVRILTIADIFDALTAWDRPYRKAASIERAMSILWEESNSGKLDKHLVGAFSERVVPKLTLPTQQDKIPEAGPKATGDYSLFMPHTETPPGPK